MDNESNGRTILLELLSEKEMLVNNVDFSYDDHSDSGHSEHYDDWDK